jgi:lysophospholipase L1-like esterase
MDIDEANRQRHLYIDTLKKLGKALNVEVLDVYKPLCNDRGCSMLRRDHIIYRDNNHLNIRGSQLVGQYIVEQLRNRPTY